MLSGKELAPRLKDKGEKRVCLLLTSPFLQSNEACCSTEIDSFDQPAPKRRLAGHRVHPPLRLSPPSALISNCACGLCPAGVFRRRRKEGSQQAPKSPKMRQIGMRLRSLGEINVDIVTQRRQIPLEGPNTKEVHRIRGCIGDLLFWFLLGELYL